MSEKQFVYKSTLKEMYGLTDSMIKRLGDPDKKIPNPHYRSGPPASLYSIARVEQWIDSHQEEVDKTKARRVKRSVAAKKAASTRARRLLEWAETTEIEILDFPQGKRLEREIFSAFSSFRIVERDDDYVDPGEYTMSYNAKVAHIRHNYTNYHYLLYEIRQQPGTAEAYQVIRGRVNDEIANRLDQ